MVKNRISKILYFVTEDWYFCSHRIDLARAAKSTGYEIVVVTQVNQHGDTITNEGFKLIPFTISRRGKNPITELKVILRLIAIYRKERPSIVHHVALKPVIYGSIAARIARVPRIVNALAGLGYVFSSKHWKVYFIRSFIKILFKFLFNKKNNRVILQNPDDRNLLTTMKLLKSDYSVLILGSGVDTDNYVYIDEPEGDLVITLASRMLWDKGVKEFVDAAKNLINIEHRARFVLVGDTDNENPSAIPESQLLKWKESGVVEWWGYRDDMPNVFSKSHIVCLPTYYGEGIPKVLIEAAACGRPIVTTDTPGCREIVQHGDNGLLIPVRDVDKLTSAIHSLINDKELRMRMGKRGRILVENKFHINKIIHETLNVYQDLLTTT